MSHNNLENEWPENGSTEFADLVALARRGDKRATGKLIDRWRNYLLLIANENLDQDLHAKIAPSDIVQQSMINVQEHIADFRGSSESEFQAWIRTILKNNVHAARRKYKSSQRRDLKREIGINDSAGPAPILVDPQVSPRTSALQVERSTVLELAMNKLPDHYRQVIQLRNYDQLTFGQIAQQIGGTEDTSRKLWSRAILRLQQVINDDNPGFQSESIENPI